MCVRYPMTVNTKTAGSAGEDALLPLAAPAMEWANSAVLSSIAATKMYLGAVELFSKGCSKRHGARVAQDPQLAQLGGHARTPGQLLRVALQGMVAAVHQADQVFADAAPGHDARLSQQPVGSNGVAATLSNRGMLQPSSDYVLAAASSALALSLQAAVSLGVSAIEEVPQVPPNLCGVISTSENVHAY